MGRRALPVVLVLAAVLLDAAGRQSLASSVLVLAVPAAAAAGLTAFGRLVHLSGAGRGVAAARADALLGAVGLAAIVVAAAARASAVEGAGVPPLAASAVVVCMGAFALQGFVALLASTSGGEPAEQSARKSSDPAEQARAA